MDLLVGLQEYATNGDLHEEWKMVTFSFNVHANIWKQIR